MEEGDWLKHILEKMQTDIDEIKDDVKHLSQWKWNIAGGTAVICTILTIAINVLHVWMRA